MSDTPTLKEPRCLPPLDPDFRPAALAYRAFRQEVEASGKAVPLVLGFRRAGDRASRYETQVFDAEDERSRANLFHVERLVKFLLWQRGAYRVYVGGPARVGDHIARTYSAPGARAFDARFLGETVYDEPFQVVRCLAEDVPAAQEDAKPLGGHLDGYRIGFDLGASDMKVSAVVAGETVYSEEIVWAPRLEADPTYHYEIIVSALKKAASNLPRVDAIGGSAAGIYIGNSPRVATLFRGVPEERFDEVRSMFQRIGIELGAPLEVVNDGNVSALAGSMTLEDDRVLGIALGSSEAAGYVGANGAMNDWLNELAFAPIDYSPTAPEEEWSGDRGCGARYLSQQCVFRLAERAGIVLPVKLADAEKLKMVQERLETGHAGAVDIWRSMGYYLGYALAHYAEFYDLKHVVLLGRCTSGSGGQLLLEGARDVLRREFPEHADQVHVHLPDEMTRRVGQSIAAASLPVLRG